MTGSSKKDIKMAKYKAMDGREEPPKLLDVLLEEDDGVQYCRNHARSQADEGETPLVLLHEVHFGTMKRERQFTYSEGELVDSGWYDPKKAE